MPVKLDEDIKFLQGVGPKRAELLNSELQIYTFKDLLYYFPYKYIDRTRFYKVCDIHPNLAYIQLKGKIIHLETVGAKYKKRLVAQFTDGTGSVELVWFRGHKWIKESIKPGAEYVIFGKPSLYNKKINIAHPEMEETAAQEQKINASLQAHYNTTEKLKNNLVTSRTLQRLQNALIKQVRGKIPESLPGYLIEKHRLISINDALENIHFPKDAEILKKAQFRLKFDELFYIQLHILKQKAARQLKFKGFIFKEIGRNFNAFYNKNLPFELTNAQKRVIKEIRKDVGSGVQMNRLLQGDVGSGKTLVALMSMLIALDNGYQACIMAPTEILAEQHYKTICRMLEGLDIQTGLLTGTTKKKAREELHEQLLSGGLQILIGTHALIEDEIGRAHV